MQPSLFDEVALEEPLAPRHFGNSFERLRAEAAMLGEEGEPNVFRGEFWTNSQRQGHSLHEVSYRACFKPQLAAFFIERFSRESDLVYDPFMGRGTTVLEAALRNRRAWGNDLNRVCARLIEPRLSPPCAFAVRERLEMTLPLAALERDELTTFYHPQTLAELEAWRRYFAAQREENTFDEVDGWIEMVACSRLSGHSPGFFSVYTLPPNQAVSVQSQRKINARRNQTPPERDTRALIWRKTTQLLGDAARPAPLQHRVTSSCASQAIPWDFGSVNLILTSPPFLNVVDYRADNWLRAWFLGVNQEEAALWQTPRLDEWEKWMKRAFHAWHSLLRPSGVAIVEVGEVNGGKVDLEKVVAKAGGECGFKVEAILINSGRFTKTANCWGVDNMSKGTNSNRLVVFSRQD